jgi:hypothetical protein
MVGVLLSDVSEWYYSVERRSEISLLMKKAVEDD